MRQLALVAGLFLFAAASAVSADDKIDGAVWEIKFDGKKDGPSVTFRATHDGKIYDRGAKVIGSWKGDLNKSEMDITGLEQARFNGAYVITNISNKPKTPRWNGKFTPADGGKSRDVGVRLLRD